jgi:very-short-patch-repair endonuclease
VAIHRGNLPPEELGVMRGIVVTSAPRTLLDLSGVATEPRLRRLVKEAEFQSLCDAESLHEVLARHPRKRGRRTLARLVEDHVLAGRATRSEMEDRFLAFCAHRDLPLPETNVALEIGGRRFEIDCLWRGERVALELDGRRAHATDTAFESDRERDRMLLAAGWTPTRATWTQLHQYGDALEADLRTILRRFRPRIGA